MRKTCNCRGCGKLLNGDGSQMSAVSDPDTNLPAKLNYYGGWVCSRQCDYNSSLRLEQSMPGHTGQTRLSLGSSSYKSIEENWRDRN
jgi:hypothetical protein